MKKISLITLLILVLYGVAATAVPDKEKFEKAKKAKDKYTPEFFQNKGAQGIGISDDDIGGNPFIVAYVKDVSSVAGIPQEVDGVNVRTIISGEFHALGGVRGVARELAPPPGKGGGNGGGGGGGEPTCVATENCRPAQLGVSIGHPDITAGTLGARVTKEGTSEVFILSNNHVLANSNNAVVGQDDAYQPGPYDGGTVEDDIGDLSAFIQINFDGSCNYVDAAIATVHNSGDVVKRTIGGWTPKSATIGAYSGMKVKKCGRTTGCTEGRVQATNTEVNVNYGSPGVARFCNQIVVTPGSFSAGGDSGSLVVMNGKGQDKDHDLKPIGLLYAGSSTHTILNPIDDVLSSLDISIDGN